MRGNAMRYADYADVVSIEVRDSVAMHFIGRAAIKFEVAGY